MPFDSRMPPAVKGRSRFACRRSVRHAAVGLGLLALSWLTPVATASGVTLPHTQAFTLASPETGRDYLIQVALPEAPPPAGGYPVLYVLDGNARLPLVLAARDTLSGGGPRADGSPLLIVAIGYPDVERFAVQRRAADYTPPTAERDEVSGESGEAEAFLEFIETRLKPEIAARFAVDAECEALLGHSLGGLFTLHTLLTRPSSFERFIAISPSLWWYGEHPLEVLAERASSLAQPAVAPRVLVGVGGLEQTPSEQRTGSARAERLRERAMVDNTRAFAEWLAAKRPGWETRFRLFSGEHHGSVMWPATREALEFLKEP